MSVVGGEAEGGGAAAAAEEIICIDTTTAGGYVEGEQAARAAWTLAKSAEQVAFQAFAAYTSAPDGKASRDETAYKDALNVAKTTLTEKKACEDAVKAHRTKLGHNFNELVTRAKDATVKASEAEVARARTHAVWKLTSQEKTKLATIAKIARLATRDALAKLNTFTTQANRGFEEVDCPGVSLYLLPSSRPERPHSSTDLAT